MKKTLFTLNVDGYSKEITELTYPLLKWYARKIGADFYTITKRKFPDWPVTYEKMQIHELAKQFKSDWNIYIDSDALIHPEALDWTVFLPKDYVAHNGIDLANLRWRYNEYFLRDGRHIGSCNWYAIASDWCIDLWKPLDISFEEAIQNVFPVMSELNTIITPEHLIDDYAVSRNIARYGLKIKPILQIQKELGLEMGFHWHVYTEPTEKKVELMKEVLDKWQIPKHIRNFKG